VTHLHREGDPASRGSVPGRRRCPPAPARRRGTNASCTNRLRGPLLVPWAHLPLAFSHASDLRDIQELDPVPIKEGLWPGLSFAGNLAFSEPSMGSPGGLPCQSRCLDTISRLAPDKGICWGDEMPVRCSACGAEMRLMQVGLRGDPTVALAFEHRTYKCSVCPQISQRLEFCRPKLPVSNLPVATTTLPQPQAVKLQERIPNWTKAVDELQNRRTAQTAAAARSLAWAKVAEKVRSRQTALKERAAGAKTSDTVRSGDAPAAKPPATPPEKL
jgi:hypothetical protein